MNQDEIINIWCDLVPKHTNKGACNFQSAATELAYIVAAAEREACASICFQEGPSIDGELIADAIRARGKHEQ